MKYLIFCKWNSGVVLLDSWTVKFFNDDARDVYAVKELSVYCLYFGGNLVSWKSKKQQVVWDLVRSLSIEQWMTTLLNLTALNELSVHEALTVCSTWASLLDERRLHILKFDYCSLVIIFSLGYEYVISRWYLALEHDKGFLACL